LQTLNAQKGITLVDPSATKETKALAGNLLKLSKQHILFGHQQPNTAMAGMVMPIVPT